MKSMAILLSLALAASMSHAGPMFPEKEREFNFVEDNMYDGSGCKEFLIIFARESNGLIAQWGQNVGPAFFQEIADVLFEDTLAVQSRFLNFSFYVHEASC